MKIHQPHRLQWMVVDEAGEQFGPFPDREEAEAYIRSSAAVLRLAEINPDLAAAWALIPPGSSHAVDEMADSDPDADFAPGDSPDVSPATSPRKWPLMEGWLILRADGRPWDEVLYPSEQAALTTAEQCSVAGFSVVAAKRVYPTRAGGVPQLVFTRP